MSQLRNQLDQDVERLRKAAERIQEMREVNMELAKDRAVAVSALKIISTWARCMRLTDPLAAAEDARAIRERAMDTLRLMGEAK